MYAPGARFFGGGSAMSETRRGGGVPQASVVGLTFIGRENATCLGQTGKASFWGLSVAVRAAQWLVLLSDVALKMLSRTTSNTLLWLGPTDSVT
ncbi:hypothetical protein CSC82_19735 [Rhodobacteraceae bacterium 4F10]|nr:hypothetical protein CSC82_19735 [Rhodobacteraceae bacterium 4F10]